FNFRDSRRQTSTEQVQVLCRSVRLSGPKCKKRRAFEREFVSMLRASKSITRIVQSHTCRALADSPRLCCGQQKEVALERMLICSWSVHESQGLHVGPNDLADTANHGVTVDFVHRGLLLPK